MRCNLQTAARAQPAADHALQKVLLAQDIEEVAKKKAAEEEAAALKPQRVGGVVTLSGGGQVPQNNRQKAPPPPSVTPFQFGEECDPDFLFAEDIEQEVQRLC
jgi:hypothetical protein